ncbi:MAG: hypothetical protein WHX53_06015 [Anaerolineae bacterium]
MEHTESKSPVNDPIADPLPPYEPPRVITYRGKDILRMLGPINACSFGHSVVTCAPNPYATAPWERSWSGNR